MFFKFYERLFKKLNVITNFCVKILLNSVSSIISIIKFFFNAPSFLINLFSEFNFINKIVLNIKNKINNMCEESQKKFSSTLNTILEPFFDNILYLRRFEDEGDLENVLRSYSDLKDSKELELLSNKFLYLWEAVVIAFKDPSCVRNYEFKKNEEKIMKYMLRKIKEIVIFFIGYSKFVGSILKLLTMIFIYISSLFYNFVNSYYNSVNSILNILTNENESDSNESGNIKKNSKFADIYYFSSYDEIIKLRKYEDNHHYSMSYLNYSQLSLIEMVCDRIKFNFNLSRRLVNFYINNRQTFLESLFIFSVIWNVFLLTPVFVKKHTLRFFVFYTIRIALVLPMFIMFELPELIHRVILKIKEDFIHINNNQNKFIKSIFKVINFLIVLFRASLIIMFFIESFKLVKFCLMRYTHSYDLSTAFNKTALKLKNYTTKNLHSKYMSLLQEDYNYIYYLYDSCEFDLYIILFSVILAVIYFVKLFLMVAFLCFYKVLNLCFLPFMIMSAVWCFIFSLLYQNFNFVYSLPNKIGLFNLDYIILKKHFAAFIYDPTSLNLYLEGTVMTYPYIFKTWLMIILLTINFFFFFFIISVVKLFLIVTLMVINLLIYAAQVFLSWFTFFLSNFLTILLISLSEKNILYINIGWIFLLISLIFCMASVLFFHMGRKWLAALHHFINVINVSIITITLPHVVHSNRTINFNLTTVIPISDTFSNFFNFRVDSTAIIFSSMVILIYSFCSSFTYFYMKEDQNQVKFMFFLTLFTVSMIYIFIANNIVALYLGWEMIGMSSFFLIAFYKNRNGSLKSGFKALFFNKISDFSFLALGAVYFICTSGTTILTNESLMASFNNIALRFIFLEISYAEIFVFLIILVSFIKSAQTIFNGWLLDSMDAPVPASALIHSATLVVAGVYLTLRFKFLIINNNFLSNSILILCVVSGIAASIAAVLQTDIKRLLANSTIANCSIMYILIISNNQFDFFLYLFTHGILKSLCFLIAGMCFYESSHKQDVRYIKLNKENNFLLLSCFIFMSLATAPISIGYDLKHSIINNIGLSYSNTNFMYFFYICFYSLSMCSFIYGLAFINLIYRDVKSHSLAEENENKQDSSSGLKIVILLYFCIYVLIQLFYISHSINFSLFAFIHASTFKYSVINYFKLQQYVVSLIAMIILIISVYVNNQANSNNKNPHNFIMYIWLFAWSLFLLF